MNNPKIVPWLTLTFLYRWNSHGTLSSLLAALTVHFLEEAWSPTSEPSYMLFSVPKNIPKYTKIWFTRSLRCVYCHMFVELILEVCLSWVRCLSCVTTQHHLLTSLISVTRLFGNHLYLVTSPARLGEDWETIPYSISDLQHHAQWASWNSVSHMTSVHQNLVFTNFLR